MIKAILKTLFLVGLAVQAFACDPGQSAADRAVEDASAWLKQGEKLGPDEVAKQEAALAKEPADPSSRAKLISYYFHQNDAGEAGIAFRRHYGWLVSHDPRSVVFEAGSYGDIIFWNKDAELGALWKKAIEQTREDAAVINHAVWYFYLNDRAECLTLCERSIALGSKDPDLYWFAGDLLMDSERTQEDARKALGYYETLIGLSNAGYGHVNAANYDNFAEAARRAGDLEKAKSFEKIAETMEDGQADRRAVQESKKLMAELLVKKSK